jgi:spore maturation protein CgeB
MREAANDYAFARAFRRAGHSFFVVSNEAFFPTRWRNPVVKAIRRVVRPLVVADDQQALIAEACRLRPELLFVFKGSFVAAEPIDAIRALGAVAVNFYPASTAHTSHARRTAKSISPRRHGGASSGCARPASCRTL